MTQLVFVYVMAGFAAIHVVLAVWISIRVGTGSLRGDVGRPGKDGHNGTEYELLEQMVETAVASRLSALVRRDDLPDVLEFYYGLTSIRPMSETLAADLENSVPRGTCRCGAPLPHSTVGKETHREYVTAKTVDSYPDNTIRCPMCRMPRFAGDTACPNIECGHVF